MAPRKTFSFRSTIEIHCFFSLSPISFDSIGSSIDAHNQDFRKFSLSPGCCSDFSTFCYVFFFFAWLNAVYVSLWFTGFTMFLRCLFSMVIGICCTRSTFSFDVIRTTFQVCDFFSTFFFGYCHPIDKHWRKVLFFFLLCTRTRTTIKTNLANSYQRHKSTFRIASFHESFYGGLYGWLRHWFLCICVISRVFIRPARTNFTLANSFFSSSHPKPSKTFRCS